MMMVFYSSTTTPLFLSGWAPTDSGQFAATCIFLAVLAILARLLVSVKPLIEARRWTVSSKTSPATPTRRTICVLERALYDTLVAALGYLIMLAAMTMNVAYFLSILAGVFFGSLVSGPLAANSHDADWLHC